MTYEPTLTAQEVYDALLYKPKTVWEICDEIGRYSERPRSVDVAMRLKELEAEDKVIGLHTQDRYPHSLWARKAGQTP